MKITALSAQVHNPDRVNVSVDGKYRFSLDISQVIELAVRVGKEVSEAELAELETEGQFGKLYQQALEYSLMRPHSIREMKDYLYKKTLTKMYRSRKGEIREREGYSPTLTLRVLEKLQQKGYVDDERFANWWVENRNVRKGTSLRKLTMELRVKGVSAEVIESVVARSPRSDSDELTKIIEKKRSRYVDDQKLMQYLARQGFSYDDIKSALDQSDR